MATDKRLTVQKTVARFRAASSPIRSAPHGRKPLKDLELDSSVAFNSKKSHDWGNVRIWPKDKSKESGTNRINPPSGYRVISPKTMRVPPVQ